ncbi:hypothetical protein Ade02nite_23620 [Paractinoplanes deccanensis]|uniref:Uncharacterized protein n=1 Tax=Paractinoplanes deccanensis TaxID=113561 RepID=A0ABQ3Y167_9ACTN|nr:hypothetical protein [Actinoplanes deccanensis]GID73721.1 hypothetical protein Ade02nite_23620 [Actinoplanes deccanensis]
MTSKPQAKVGRGGPLGSIMASGARSVNDALAEIHRRLSQESDRLAPEQILDLSILRVELSSYVDLEVALDDCTAVAERAMEMQPAADHGRVLVLLAVSADVNLRYHDSKGRPHPNAVLNACYSYRRACAHNDPTANLSRFVLAAALMAIAEYHHTDCGKGRQQLAGLFEKVPGNSAAAVMLRAAKSAMDDRCRRPKALPIDGPIPALFGGAMEPLDSVDLLSPVVADEAVLMEAPLKALAARVDCQPGRHLHGAHVVTQTPRQPA